MYVDLIKFRQFFWKILSIIMMMLSILVFLIAEVWASDSSQSSFSSVQAQQLALLEQREIALNDVLISNSPHSTQTLNTIDFGFNPNNPAYPQGALQQAYSTQHYLAYGLSGFLSLMLLGAWYRLNYFSKQSFQYQSFLQAAPIPMLVVDASGKILDWNQQTTSLFGWQPTQVLGHKLESFFGIRPQLFAQILAEQTQQESGVLRLAHRTRHDDWLNVEWRFRLCDQTPTPQWICSVMPIDVPDTVVHREATHKTSLQNAPAGNAFATALSNPQPVGSVESVQDACDSMLDEAAELSLILNLALLIWQSSSGKGKVQLAEESKLWRVTIDSGTAKTRTFDKYLKKETLPKRARWRNVIQTAHFVLRSAPESPQKQQLEALVETFSQTKLNQLH